MWQKKGIFTLLVLIAIVVIAFYHNVFNSFFVVQHFMKSKISDNDIRFLVNDDISLLEWICIPPVSKNIKPCRPPHTELISFSADSNITVKIKGQKVRNTTLGLKKDYTLLNDTVAIFHGYAKTSFPNNLFHFVTQYYIPFHYLLDFSNSLKITKAMKKTIFFLKPLGDKCIGKRFASFFLGSLNVTDSRKYAYTHRSHPGGVCYRYAIFSDQLFSEHTDKAAVHLQNFYGVKTRLCPKKQIVLSKRSNYRFWTNIDDLHKAAIAAGFTNTSVVNFAKIPLKQQLGLVYCTDVLVSPHAAVLQWSNFMRPYSTVIEIAWPKYGWDFFYSNKSGKWYGHPPLHYIQVETEDVTNVDASIAEQLKISRQRARALMDLHPIKELVEKHRRMGKTCNFHLDKGLFIKVLKEAVSFTN